MNLSQNNKKQSEMHYRLVMHRVLQLIAQNVKIKKCCNATATKYNCKLCFNDLLHKNNNLYH